MAAFARREPDRVPINYMSNPGIAGRLKEHFGGKDGRDALEVDFRGIAAAALCPVAYVAYHVLQEVLVR